ncbi:MAG: 7-cyano-7-deazaguanine synthase QueC [Acidobacteria bacterium]|nr:MAG: 7-cyano-7-deazaguanine synthase QueC [Acidobacteriota bacterium]PYS11110.1 MAG: 7-cyano-7-deazaguanine synthase QueC [Acidobacteriota bacterium]
MKAVVLISGGMDSCVTAAIASRNYQIAALHASYGQPTERRELQSFHSLADYFGAVERMAVKLDHFRSIGGSSLTDSRMPIHDSNLTSREIPNTYVPFRNAHFLSIATSWAEVLGATKIFIGAVWEDSSGYPDCRPEYYEAFNKVIRAGTRPTTDVVIETPLIYLSKSDIVQRGAALDAPFHLTWSCYRNSDIACGACDSCALRLRAFRRAGIEDPLAYSAKPDYAA